MTWASAGLRWSAIFLFVACAHQPPDAERWFTERGQRAESWDVCVKLGASLRSACAGNAACEGAVTADFTFHCYAGRYQASTANDPPVSSLSPCFWNRAPQQAASPQAYADAQCDRLALDASLRTHCVAELRAVVEGLCTAGFTALTGAGP